MHMYKNSPRVQVPKSLGHPNYCLKGEALTSLTFGHSFEAGSFVSGNYGA